MRINCLLNFENFALLFHRLEPQKKDSFDSYSDKEEETKNAQMLNIEKIKADNISIASLESASSPNTRIAALEKQLNIEQKVKCI